MKLDREKALKAFKNYVNQFDVQDEKIKLKIDHTYRVSDLCEEIAKSLHLSEEEIDIAWMTGLLHDVGRFEQLKKFGTFEDGKSIDHAKMSIAVLFAREEDTKEVEIALKEKGITDIPAFGTIREYVSDANEDDILYTAVKWHSAYRIPEDLSDKDKMYCQILRDADKIDIFKVNCIVPREEIYNVTTEALRNDEVTKEVMEAFYEEHAILRALRKTAVDFIVGHIALVYELVYPVSLRIVKEQGCVEQLLNFDTDNEKTRAQFEEIKKYMHEFIERKMPKGEKA